MVSQIHRESDAAKLGPTGGSGDVLFPDVAVDGVDAVKLWPRRREQEERMHKIAALKKQATAGTEHLRPKKVPEWTTTGIKQ